MQRNPTFTVFVGPMMSTKTTSMLLRVERLELQHKRVRIFKPSIDDRYDVGGVVTHSGWRKDATCIRTGVDMLSYIDADMMKSSIDVIAVDEMFMLKDVAETLIWLFRNGMSVIVSTLDLSFRGKPFKEVERIIPWATEIYKCAAVCTVCGADAYYTYRKIVDDADDSIDNSKALIGGTDLYEARCFTHHPFVNKRGDYDVNV